MKIISFLLILLMCTTLHAEDVTNKQEYCNLQHSTNFKLFDREASFYAKNCLLGGEDEYLKNYIVFDKKEHHIGTVSNKLGSDAKIEAISLYNNFKNPIIIIISSKTLCCHPQPSGKYYIIKLYEILEKDQKISFKDITSILRENSEGFDGISDGKVNYKLKTISDIRNWLKKNYKSDNINLKNTNSSIYLSDFKINSLIIDNILNLKRKSNLLIHSQKEAFKFFPNLEKITEQSDSKKFIFLNIDNIKYAISINSYDLDNGNVSNEYKLINLNRKDFVENLGYWFNISKDKKLQYKDENGKMKIIKLD